MDKQALIDGLNKNLADEMAAVILYSHQAATASGALGHELREMLKVEVADEVAHIQFLADKIVILGGNPTTQPSPIKVHKDAKDMIRYDIELERGAIQSYAEHARLAEQAGEFGLRIRLEEMAAEETEHLEELQRLLTV